LSNREMVLVQDLVKIYPGGTRAVAGIEFSVAEGEFFGFLGPNGAGKSTTIKILSTLIKKTSGRAEVMGIEVEQDPTAVRRRIGFAMQEVGLDDLSTGWDFLTLQGVLYGLSQSKARARAGELLELVGLTSVAKRRIATYSGGMRRRLDLASALMHSPPLLFLDEPTTGLDPQSRLAIWEYLAQLNKEGVTIFLTTQIMEEADRLCKRIAIIDMGRLVAQGSPQALKAEVGGDVVHITIGQPNSDGQGDLKTQAQALLSSRSYVVGVVQSHDGISLTVKDGGAALPDLLRVLHENQIPVTNLSVSRPTLDDVFLKHTGKNIRSEGASGDVAGQALRPWLGLSNRR